jgi:pyruvate formate lyase activating enzyme
MVDTETSCICFFGGDPTPFIDHSISTARHALANSRRILRICWESNGSMGVNHAKEIGDVALETGGCVKIDLKAWNESLHRVLCGTTNKWTVKNIELLSQMASSRREVPLLIVSTPLIPGYVDEEEISAIASFLADLDRDIPYSLLAFHPEYLMSDLPTTSRAHAQRCLEAARDAGLRRVNIGNEWLLR